MINKKIIKAIRKGDYGALIDSIEYLIETYDEDKFDDGYKSCISDLSVHAHRLAEVMYKEAERRGVKADKKGHYILEQDEVEQIINDFFTDIINDYGK